MTSTLRSRRYETGRCLANNIMLRGDSSKLNSSDANSRNGTISLDGIYSNEHIHINTASIDFSRNNPQDELKLAFSVVSREESNTVLPPIITRIYIEFLHTESDTAAGYARVYGEIWDDDITGNRYVILTRKLSDFDVSSDFSWSKVRVVRIFASCYTGAGLSDQYYVSLDAMRFDNVSSLNPLYIMTGYNLVDEGYENDPLPIYKVPNTSNYIEFRENIEVV